MPYRFRIVPKKKRRRAQQARMGLLDTMCDLRKAERHVL
jgi:hypothetical protein